MPPTTTLVENQLLQWNGGNPDPPGQLFESNANTAITDAGQLTLAGALLSTINAGVAPTGVTALEYGNGILHQTHLTIALTNCFTSVDNNSLASGVLIYTFPAGNILVLGAMADVAITMAEDEDATPDVGIGTVMGSGVVAVLGGTPEFEDILAGSAAGDCNGTYKDYSIGLAAPKGIPATAAHTAHFNIAAAWSDEPGLDLTGDLAGTVSLIWAFLGT